jgi:hypothetical protein
MVVPGGPETSREQSIGDTTTLVPMQVGSAVVFVEYVGEPVIEGGAADDSIYPVAPPSPGSAFDMAADALRECVRIVGERLERLGRRRPDEVSVEFSLSFQVKGKATFIPVFVTAESGATTGLKITAVWRPSATTSDD